MPTSLGPAEILVILVVALIVLGPKKLPEAGRQVGRAIAEVRRWTSDVTREMKTAIDIEAPAKSTVVEPKAVPHTPTAVETRPQPAPVTVVEASTVEAVAVEAVVLEVAAVPEPAVVAEPAVAAEPADVPGAAPAVMAEPADVPEPTVMAAPTVVAGAGTAEVPGDQSAEIPPASRP